MNSRNKNRPRFQIQNEPVPNPSSTIQTYDAACDRNRMTRLILESLEVALLLCNLFFERYGLAKLFSIVNQILPTAYIVNTGYWIFYASQNGYCICICNRFGLRCPHRRRGFHWIDIDAMQEAEEKYLFSVQNGKMFPVGFNINIDPIIKDCLRAYDINIRLTVQPFDLLGNIYVPISDQQTTLLIDARYIITPSYNPLKSAVVQFNPHPMSHPHYSQYFECLQRLNVFYSSAPLEVQVPRTSTIICSDIPNFTVITNNSATSNFHPTQDMNLPTWSGPFSTFHGHFDDIPPTSTHINQQYFNFNITTNSNPISQPPPSYNQAMRSQQHPPYTKELLYAQVPQFPQVPPFPQVSPYKQVPLNPQVSSYSQVPLYNPAYQNRTNNRQFGEQVATMRFPITPDSVIKQKRRGKTTVPTRPNDANSKLSSKFQLPSVSRNNVTYDQPSCSQSSSLLTATSSSIHIITGNINTDQVPIFNPTVRRPLQSDTPKPTEVNFFGPDYRDSFPALPEPKHFQKKIKTTSTAPTTQKSSDITSDFNENMTSTFDPILSSNIQNLKAQVEVQSIVSISYDTEVSQMPQQPHDENCADIASDEFLTMVSDVIKKEIDKDPSIIKPQEFDEFQQANADNIQMFDSNSSDVATSPEDDSLYIDEYKFIDDEDKK